MMSTQFSDTSMETDSLAKLIEWGVAKRAAPGQEVSGDEFLIKPFPNGLLVAVVDGLGHGDEATAAARIAVNTLSEHADESILMLVDRCHGALRETRGVVMTLGVFRLQDRTITWMGVGNVEGVLLRHDPKSNPVRESVLMRGGVVGYQLPTLSASILTIKPGDLMIFATDGIRHGYADNYLAHATPQQMADRIMSQYFKGTDDALVLVVHYLGLTL
jgi:negative regulator of sigma-B (phosphoserine phosphatase)